MEFDCITRAKDHLGGKDLASVCGEAAHHTYSSEGALHYSAEQKFTAVLKFGSGIQLKHLNKVET